jgi:hypothetical protein
VHLFVGPTRSLHRSSRPSAPRRRYRPRAVLLTPVFGGCLALLVSACGGSSSAGGPTNSQSPTSQMLAFSRCMRSQGVSEFPDPPTSGKLAVPSAQRLGVTSTQFQAAQSACQRLLPTGGPGITQAEVQQEWHEFRTFTQCMRHHGMPNWPEPTNRSETDKRPIFKIQPVDPNSAINPDSPQIRAKLHACDSLLRTQNPNHL